MPTSKVPRREEVDKESKHSAREYRVVEVDEVREHSEPVCVLRLW